MSIPWRMYSATGTFVLPWRSLSRSSCSGVMYTVVETLIRPMSIRCVTIGALSIRAIFSRRLFLPDPRRCDRLLTCAEYALYGGLRTDRSCRDVAAAIEHLPDARSASSQRGAHFVALRATAPPVCPPQNAHHKLISL